MRSRVPKCGSNVAWFCAAAALLFCSGSGFAQVAVQGVRVLQSSKFDLGDRSITYNRIATPVAAIPPPAQAAVATPPGDAAPDVAAFKPVRLLVVTAFVYNHSVSDVYWSDGAASCHAYSNIDFNLLLSQNFVESDEFDYMLILSVVNSTPPNGPLANPLPAPEQFPAWSAFMLAPDNPAPPQPEAMAGLNAIGDYLDANRPALAAQYAARVATPPVPQKSARPPDIVVNFWPIRSNLSPSANGGVQTTGGNR